jgi:hypothetical protein
MATSVDVAFDSSITLDIDLSIALNNFNTVSELYNDSNDSRSTFTSSMLNTNKNFFKNFVNSQVVNWSSYTT